MLQRQEIYPLQLIAKLLMQLHFKGRNNINERKTTAAIIIQRFNMFNSRAWRHFRSDSIIHSLEEVRFIFGAYIHDLSESYNLVQNSKKTRVDEVCYDFILAS